jgi:predicted DsbA family dithiol-disulfide isomerase
MQVEVVSDLVCPWCYIGKRRFDNALAQLATPVSSPAVTITYRAYQLDPGAPQDTAPEPVRDVYARKFGGVARADEILANVTAVARDEGITFNMHNAVRANTLRAHRLLKLVELEAPLLQAAVNESIMAAYFTEGRNIADVATLIDCAARVGFSSNATTEQLVSDDPLSGASSGASSITARAVAADLLWAADRDITAVPTFVINDSFAVPGAQDTNTFVRLLTKMSGQ